MRRKIRSKRVLDRNRGKRKPYCEKAEQPTSGGKRLEEREEEKREKTKREPNVEKYNFRISQTTREK